MALGATAAAVRRMVVAQGARVVALGVAIGLLVAFAATRALGGLLFGVAAVDAPTFAAMALLMLVIGGLAAYVPGAPGLARRSLRIAAQRLRSRRDGWTLREERLHDVGGSLDADELLIEALVAEREGVVVQAEAGAGWWRAGRAWWTGSFDDVVAEVVGLAVDRARLHAPAGQPHRVAARVVVAPVVVRR